MLPSLSAAPSGSRIRRRTLPEDPSKVQIYSLLSPLSFSRVVIQMSNTPKVPGRFEKK